jgi:hypothetical protein
MSAAFAIAFPPDVIWRVYCFKQQGAIFAHSSREASEFCHHPYVLELPPIEADGRVL